MYTGIFNPDSSTPAYVGFMYGTLDGSNYAENFANTNKSYAMKALEVFYSNSLKMYDDKIADVIWCNDKSIYSNEDIDDDEIEDISFGITGRINNPSLICPNDALGGNLSKYTVNDTIYGNGTLKYKVGLLTADELLFAGYSDIIENKSVYLEENAEGNTWTTLTPYKYMSTGLVGLLKVVDAAIDTGTIATSVSGEYFRPAIALKPNIEISGGTGTSEDPYIVK